MPTFFERVRRFLSGEAVYRPGEDADGVEERHEDKQYKPDASGQAPQQPGQQPMSQHSAEVMTQRTGPKVIPAVVVEKVENRVSGPYLDVSLTFRNNSQVNVILDEVHLLGVSRKLNEVMLEPGRDREFVSVYNGPLLKNRNYTHAEVHYRTETGDYFSAIHNLEFEQQSDGSYTIYHMKFIPPVKDL